jgi:hypothetical protein
LDAAVVRDLFLQKLKRAGEIEFQEEMFLNPVYDEALGKVVVGIAAQIAAKVVEPECVRYPDGWWQAVKERFFPGFIKRWAPVRYKVFDALVVFPKLINDLKKEPLDMALKGLINRYNVQFVFLPRKESDVKKN